MNPQKRARRLQKIALRAARRAQERRNGKPLTREELLALPVSTLARFWSLFLISLGILIAVLGVVLISAPEAILPGIVILAVGVLICVFGFRGRPRPLQSSLNTFDPTTAQLIFDAIIEGLKRL